MEGDIKYLQNELEHENTTIDRLLDILNKATYQNQHTDTYNQNIDVYNDNVSTHNNNPLKNSNNVTTRKKRKLNHSSIEENDSSHCSGGESVLKNFDNVTIRRKKKLTPNDHFSVEEVASSCVNVVESDIEIHQQQSIPSMREQLREYKTNKHSDFLATDEGITWQRKQGDPEGDIEECPNFSESDMEKLNNMYEEFELDDGPDDDDDMSISTNEDEIRSDIERVYKEPLPPQALWRHGTTLIIGDSMIGGIDERRLRNTKVRSHPGASVEDLHYHITPYLRKKPTNIIIHVGTNNARSDNSDMIIEKLI